MKYGKFGGQYVPEELKNIVKKYNKNDSIIVNLSGRGDKDLELVLNKNKGGNFI